MLCRGRPGSKILGPMGDGRVGIRWSGVLMREPLDHFWICWVKLGLPGQMGHPLYLTYLRYLHTYVCTYLDGVTGYVHIRFPRRDAWWVTGGHFIPFYFEACTYIPT